MARDERERCLAIAIRHLERAKEFYDKSFADGYSFACQAIAGAIGNPRGRKQGTKDKTPRRRRGPSVL